MKSQEHIDYFWKKRMELYPMEVDLFIKEMEEIRKARNAMIIIKEILQTNSPTAKWIKKELSILSILYKIC